MATIPSYKDWMKDTGSLLSPRSDFLKQVDDALKSYEAAPGDQTRTKLKEALDRWRFEQSRQGKDWRKSVRNSKGTVTNLHRALTDVDQRRLSNEERMALLELQQMQLQALRSQFLLKEVTWKSSTLMGMKNAAGTGFQQFKAAAGAAMDAGSTASTVNSIVKNTKIWTNNVAELSSNHAQTRYGGAVAQNRETIELIRTRLAEAIRKLCPDLDADAVMRSVGLTNVREFVAQVAPFFGMVSTGKDAALALIGVATRVKDRYIIGHSRHVMRPGDPEKAFDAVLIMLNRDLASQVATAGRASLAFTGQGLVTLFTGPGVVLAGPIISALNLLAQILQTIVEYVRDYREMTLANKLLRDGVLSWRLFEVCPLLGCYFVAIQDHSTLINMALSDYGTDNFVFDAERMVKKLRPIVDKSGEFIRASRLEIAGMERYKGIVAMNYSKKGRFDQVLGAADEVKRQISDSIESWSGKPGPGRPPVVDRSRIIGISSLEMAAALKKSTR